MAAGLDDDPFYCRNQWGSFMKEMKRGKVMNT